MYWPAHLSMPSHMPVLQRRALQPMPFSWQRHLNGQISPKGNSRTDASVPRARWYAGRTSGSLTLDVLVCAAYETGSQQANASKRRIKAIAQQDNPASNPQGHQAIKAQMAKAPRPQGHEAPAPKS